MAENMENFDSNKRKALAGTLLFHLLLLLALFFLALRTPLPLPGEEGVEVNLGYSDQGMGQIQPERPETEESSTPPPPAEAQRASADEEVVTQRTEDAPSLPERREERPRNPVNERPAERPRQETPNRTPPEQTPVETPPQPQVNQRALFRGSSTGSNTSSEGITGQTGDQGRPDGLRDVTRYDGQGGQGNGPSFSLGGRGAKYLERPSSTFREQGNIVVDIWVDRNGKVSRAEINLRGTNILDSNLRNLAVRAAMNSTFTEDPQAAQTQRGTITYTFIIGN